MKIKEKSPDEGENLDRVKKITKRDDLNIQERALREEDVETRKSSKHSESRKDRTPRKRKNKPYEL